VKKYFIAQLVIAVFFSMSVMGQEEAPKFNFNIGGGVGFPQGDTGTFTNIGGNFVAGGGLNLGRALGFNGEFMWHDLPPKSAVIAATGAPDGSAGVSRGSKTGASTRGLRFGGRALASFPWRKPS